MYTAITSAVSFTDVISAIGAVAALLAAVAVARKGAKLVLGFIR